LPFDHSIKDIKIYDKDQRPKTEDPVNYLALISWTISTSLSHFQPRFGKDAVAKIKDVTWALLRLLQNLFACKRS